MMTVVETELHEHRDPWDDERRALRDADSVAGVRPEHEVEFWIHAHPHREDHGDVLWLNHKRTPDGEMIDG